MRVIFLLIWLFVSAIAVANEPTWQRVSQTQPHMGSKVTIVAYAEDADTCKMAIKRGFDRIRELNAIFSDYEADSECTQLSKAAPTESPVKLSDEMTLLLAESLRISHQTKGAFDITVGPLSSLWRRARRRKKLPSEENIKEAVQATGFKLLEFDAKKKTVSLTKSGMRLDFGGIAKGYIADAALATVREAGCAAALVNAGGDIAIGDAPPDRKGWRIGVAPLKPREPPSRILELKNCGIATSGDAWQFVELDGKRFSHIIDPRTGWAVPRRCGVTVIAKSCTTADGLASTVSVMGPEDGIAFIERITGASCLVVEEPNDKAIAVSSTDFPKQNQP